MKSNAEENRCAKAKKPLVSIVVPIYKVESYLDNCVRSLVCQTERNIEIVLVDDGSPDECPRICDKWAGLDGRIKVVHQNNQGVTRARANGVKNTSGEWILFVDGDDVVPADSVEKMLEYSVNADIIIGQVKLVGPFKWPYLIQNMDCNRDEYLFALLQHKIHGGPVAKLFKKKLFNDFVFDIPAQIRCGEDLIMNLRLAKKANSIRLIEHCVYHYIFRESSAIVNDPFVSVRYTILFNRLLVQSIDVHSMKMRLCVRNNLLFRYWDCVKSKVRRLLGK